MPNNETNEYDHPDVQAESALAQAQSLIQVALTAGPRRQHEIRKLLGANTRYLKDVRKGEYDLTVRELGKILAASGFDLTLGMEVRR